MHSEDHHDRNSEPPKSILGWFRRILIGKPRDLTNSATLHNISLVAFLAWVGLGADGLSSSAYGPEEAFKALAGFEYLAIFLMAFTAFTVFILAFSYQRIIEEFPNGGGGYVVTSKILGKKIGVISGCALVVDYILTITISVAASGDALFSLLPVIYYGWKLPVEICVIFVLILLNLRGVKESVMVLTPIFLIFIVTHVFAIAWGIGTHLPQVAETSQVMQLSLQEGLSSVGFLSLFLIFIHAYSLGGGTYTGIEAVSNGLAIMREPKVRTAKRTMLYMAISLAFTAGGLILCYLLWQVTPEAGKTMNAVLFEKITATLPFGAWFVIVALVSEGFLLIVAAQAGFIDGPRVLANMAHDAWVPKRLGFLSDRLTTSNGIVLMGGAALVALLYTQGKVSHLVVMYSINVFVTFTLSIFSMLRLYWRQGPSRPKWFSGMLIFSTGFLLSLTILVITTFEKFMEGGWVTLGITGSLIGLCFIIKRHYYEVTKRLSQVYTEVDKIDPTAPANELPVEPNAKTAVILVDSYGGGIGVFIVQTILREFPGIFKNFVFVSIGVLHSGRFKGEGAIETLAASTSTTLERYVELGKKLGVRSTYRMAIGTEVVKEAVNLCDEVAQEFPHSTFFAGKVIFSEERWYHRILHNETGLSLQRRMQLLGHTMVILPAKVD